MTKKKTNLFWKSLFIYLLPSCSKSIIIYIMANLKLVTESEKIKYLSEFYAGLVFWDAFYDFPLNCRWF